MTRRLTTSLISLAALSLAVAACNKSTDTTSGRPPSSVATSSSSMVGTSSTAPGSKTDNSSTTPGSKADRSSTTTSRATATSTTAGSSSGGSEKQEFLEKGNAICKDMNQQSLALTQTYNKTSKGPADTQALLDQNGDLIEGAVAKLKALPQPPDDEAKLAAMYADVLKLAGYSHQLAAAVGSNDMAGAQQLQKQGEQLQTETNKAATDYGLTECGKGS